MAFWNNTGRDPKRNFRFKVVITGLQGGAGLVWWAKKVSKPNFTVTESKHAFLNHTYYWPGRVEWQTVTLTLVDPVDISDEAGNDGTVRKLNSLFESTGYKPLSKPDDPLITQSKEKVSSALESVQIIQMDSNDKEIESWTLHNPFIKKITYGELDYENDDLTQMEIEFRYDYAVCNVATGTGTSTPFFEAGALSAPEQ
jgi:uncharacterized protein YnzC (UPF0291/DUF896 family)